MINVLIVDDSPLVRKMVTQMLKKDPLINVIGSAKDGEEALEKIFALKPDVVTLDIDMPKLNGLEVLKRLRKERVETEVVVLSYLTTEGAETTLSAIELGAFDYVPKPDGRSISFELEKVEEDILKKVKAAYIYKGRRKKRHKETLLATEKAKRVDRSRLKLEKAVIIGISTGGPVTIKDVVPRLSVGNYAVFIVQHIPEAFSSLYAKRLNDISRLNVVEGKTGMTVEPGNAYVAKGGHQMFLEKSNGKVKIKISKEPKTIYVPNINLTMESALKIFGKNTIGVVMTGLGDDGAEALRKIKEAGGVTMAELEDTAIAYSMPREAVKKGGAEIVAPSYELPFKIMEALERR